MPNLPLSADELQSWIDAHTSGEQMMQGDPEQMHHDASEGAFDDREFKKAMTRAQRLLTVRERSSHELFSRLASAGYPDTVCQEVVSRCVRTSLIDDERFARVYVTNKKHAGWGRSRILRGLRQAGIDPCSYPDVLEDSFDEDDELGRAISLLERHRTSSSNPYRAHYAYLMRKGFSSEVSSRAVSMHLKG